MGVQYKLKNLFKLIYPLQLIGANFMQITFSNLIDNKKVSCFLTSFCNERYRISFPRDFWKVRG
jgi:hypothetical protein